jgi:hypothetical protein
MSAFQQESSLVWTDVKETWQVNARIVHKENLSRKTCQLISCSCTRTNKTCQSKFGRHIYEQMNSPRNSSRKLARLYGAWVSILRVQPTSHATTKTYTIPLKLHYSLQHKTVTLNLGPPALLGAYFKTSPICSSTFNLLHPLWTLRQASNMVKNRT